VRNLLKLVERFDDGDKIGASCIRLQTVEDLQAEAYTRSLQSST